MYNDYGVASCIVEATGAVLDARRLLQCEVADSFSRTDEASTPGTGCDVKTSDPCFDGVATKKAWCRSARTSRSVQG